MKNKIKNKNQQGIALIAVLGLLLVVALLTASIVTVTKISAMETVTFSENERSTLLAEGAAARIMWLLINDRQQFPNRTLGAADYEEQPDRIMADGTKHELKYYDGKTEFEIYDMLSGFNVYGNTPDRELSVLNNAFLMDKKGEDELNVLRNRLMDYVDADDHIRLDSLEAADYSEQKMFPLPRNDVMQFREEILYIPGSFEFFKPDDIGRLSSVNPIPPERMQNPYSSRQSIFSANELILKGKVGLNDIEIEKVLSAIEEWKTNHKPLEDSLEIDLLGRLKSNFSFNESGFYTIIVRASSHELYRGRPLAISIKLSNSITRQGLQFYEWTFY